MATNLNIQKIQAIGERYDGLSESDCCLSCGGALGHAAANPGEICVDLGSGRGTDVIRLAELVGKAGYIYGIDISPGMIEKAKKNLTKLGVANAQFLRAELESLPLPEKCADLVISNCVINHASDKQAVWHEVFRVLKPQGRFVVSDIYSLAEVPAEYRNDPAAIAECWAGSVTRDKYLLQLNQAGFTNIQILEESAPYDKGQIQVVSWTVLGYRPKGCACCH